MKTYRSEQHGFEIQIPEEWSFHSFGKAHSLIFQCRSMEAFDILITPLVQEETLEQIEARCRQDAQKRGYTSLELGTITSGAGEHVWARYYMGGGLWCKKYRIVLHQIEYAVTATCLEQRFLLAMEKDWDAIVASFHLMSAPVRAGENAEDLKQAMAYYRQAMSEFSQERAPQVPKEGPPTASSGSRPPRLTYPDLYNVSLRHGLNKKYHLTLIYAEVPDIKYATSLLMVYQWEGDLSEEEADQLRLRAAVYLSCAIYDAARRVGVPCAACTIRNGQRPTWMIEGQASPVCITLSDQDTSDQTLQMSLGPIVVSMDHFPTDKTNLKKLMKGFQELFREIEV